MATSPACCLRVTERTQSVPEIHLVPNCPASSCHRHGNQPCLLFEGNDPDREKALTYAEVLEEVCQVANWLKSKGIKKGDTVSRGVGFPPHTHHSRGMGWRKQAGLAWGMLGGQLARVQGHQEGQHGQAREQQGIGTGESCMKLFRWPSGFNPRTSGSATPHTSEEMSNAEAQGVGRWDFVLRSSRRRATGQGEGGSRAGRRRVGGQNVPFTNFDP